MRKHRTADSRWHKNDMSIEEIEAFAADLLSQMTLKQKIYQMSGHWNALADRLTTGRWYGGKPVPSGGNKRLAIPRVRFSDGPRGVVSGRSTCFPVSIARGALWDRRLEERIGEVVGAEVRANGGNCFGGVCINLLRHPAWGRSQETYSEDPYLLGEMGAALTRGVQSRAVMACVKHFAANNIENSRFKVDVRMDERTLREVYLPHFKRCVDEGAAVLMGAYNKVNGEYCCQNERLLKSILKEEWGFDGFVMSDFMWGIHETVAAAEAGLDVEMPFARYYGRKLKRAVKRGDISEDSIDASVLRILRKVIAVSANEKTRSFKKGIVASAAHVALAQEVAEKSIVLLKNEGPVLPLKRSAKFVVVAGKLATAENLGDHGSSRVRPPYVITPLQGIKDCLGEGVTVKHCIRPDEDGDTCFAEKADAVVIFAGYSHKDEGEYIPVGNKKSAGDRTRLSLCEEDISMIRHFARKNSNTVVVLIGGGAIMMEEWKNDVSAIVMAWYPGMHGGPAIARLLYGEVNPSGKLPFTIPSDARHLPLFASDIDEIEYSRYHGYTLQDKAGYQAAFPFGYGLSYTSYSYGNIAAEVKSDDVVISVDVANVGEIAGDEIVQLYVGFEHSRIDRPVKLLKDFKRVPLQRGEKKRIRMRVSVKDLSYYDPKLKRWKVEKMRYSAHVGSSSKPEDQLHIEFGIIVEEP